MFGEEAPFVAKYGEAARGDGALVQKYMTWDTENLASIVRSIGAARENARSIREVVSLEVWEIINELYLYVNGPEGRRDFDESPWSFYSKVRKLAALALGFTESTMLHDTPLDFIWLGVELERAGQTARTTDVHHHAFTTLPNKHEIMDTALWLNLLRCCCGFEPFMKRHRGAVTGPAVAAFLLLEPSFPRSVRHAIDEAYERLASIRPPSEHNLPGGRALARIEMLSATLADEGAAQLDDARVHQIVTYVVDETAVICAELGRELFGYGG